MNCGFKAYDTRLARGLHLYGDMHRYTPVLAKINGANITEIAVEHRPRVHGKSKYGSKRLLRGLFDLVTVSFLLAFLDRPLHLFGRFGAISTVGGHDLCIFIGAQIRVWRRYWGKTIIGIGCSLNHIRHSIIFDGVARRIDCLPLIKPKRCFFVWKRILITRHHQE